MYPKDKVLQKLEGRDHVSKHSMCHYFKWAYTGQVI
jgi:hypothetical protein